jgi:hypothetical protein
VREQRDLPFKALERTMFERTANEVRAHEQGDRDSGENSGADGEPESRLEGDQASCATGASRMR